MKEIKLKAVESDTNRNEAVAESEVVNPCHRMEELPKEAFLQHAKPDIQGGLHLLQIKRKWIQFNQAIELTVQR